MNRTVVCQYQASEATTNTNVVAANRKRRCVDRTPDALTMSSRKPRTCGIHLDRSEKSQLAGWLRWRRATRASSRNRYVAMSSGLAQVAVGKIQDVAWDEVHPAMIAGKPSF